MVKASRKKKKGRHHASGSPPGSGLGTGLRGRSSLAAALVMLTALGVFAYLIATYDFVQDDAYITFRYAQNLVAGNGPVYNPGERVEGYTSPLWMVTMAAALAVGLAPMITAKVLGVLSSLMLLLLLPWVADQLRPAAKKRSAIWSVMAVLWLAANGSFALWTTSGMETGSFLLLFVLSMGRYLQERRRPKLRIVSPWLLAALTLVRPEGWLVFAITFVHRWIVPSSSASGAEAPSRLQRLIANIRWAAPFFAIAGLHLVWRWIYYGYPLPNTFYAKTGPSAAYLQLGLTYTWDFLQKYALWGLVLVLPPIVLLRRADRSNLLYLIALELGFTAYVIAVGGDVLLENRFFLPVAVLMLLLLQEAFFTLASAAHTPGRVKAGLVVFSLAFAAFTLYHPRNSLEFAARANTVGTEKFVRTAEWIREQHPQLESRHSRPSPPSGDDAAVLATTAAGALAYESHIPVVDMFGLNDATIAHHPDLVEGLAGYTKEQKYNARYVLSRRPTYIYFLTGAPPSSAAEHALFLYESFRKDYWLYRVHDVLFVYRRRPDAPGAPLDVVQPGDFASLDLVPARGGYESVEFVEQFGLGVRRRGRDPEAALHNFRHAIELGPDDFGLLYEEMGMAQFELRRYGEAAASFREALSRNEYSARSHFGLGFEAFRNEDYAHARERFDRAIQLWPYYPSAYLYRGAVARAQGDLARAERDLKSGMAQTRNQVPFALELGLLYLQKNQPRQARPLLELYLRGAPADDPDRARIEQAVTQMRAQGI